VSSSQRRQPTSSTRRWEGRGWARALRVTSAPMPAGSPNAMTRPVEGGCGRFNGEGMLSSSMIRWLIVGSLITGIGVGLQNGWIEIHWNRLLRSAGLEYLNNFDPIKELSK